MWLSYVPYRCKLLLHLHLATVFVLNSTWTRPHPPHPSFPALPFPSHIVSSLPTSNQRSTPSPLPRFSSRILVHDQPSYLGCSQLLFFYFYFFLFYYKPSSIPQNLALPFSTSHCQFLSRLYDTDDPSLAHSSSQTLVVVVTQQRSRFHQNTTVAASDHIPYISNHHQTRKHSSIPRFALALISSLLDTSTTADYCRSHFAS